MIWSYGVITVPERVKCGLLDRTLDSLAKGGFDSPRLFMDGLPLEALDGSASKFQVTCRNPSLGYGYKWNNWGNWILALHELFFRNPHADRYAVFEDDLVTVRNLRQYLDQITYPDNGYFNLLCFMDNEALVKSSPSGWIEGHELTTNKARFYHGKRQQAGRGAVALVFSLDALITLLANPVMFEQARNVSDQVESRIDGGIVEAMNRVGWREYVHNPSLVLHTGIRSTKGKRWNQNAASFPGEDFDALSLIRNNNESNQ